MIKVIIKEDLYLNFKGSNEERHLVDFLKKQGIKFDENTTREFDIYNYQIIYTQKDEFDLTPCDPTRYDRYLQQFLEKYYLYV